MIGASSPVSSSQLGCHRRLDEVVRRHLASDWRRPLHAPTVKAFERLLALPGFDPGRSLVFDSGCGSGRSTRRIAERHPESVVIGIDRSEDRLSRLGFEALPARQGNAFWVQAELSSFWRLALEQGWRLLRHYLLYPNPWPKPGQLQRRWHAHPVFPALLALGGVLELRSNWKIYADEFERALTIAVPEAKLEPQAGASEADWGGIETPFGTKYAASGHPLCRLVVNLDETTDSR